MRSLLGRRPVLGTLNPQIRNAPSLSELDDLPRRPEPPAPALAG